jgi:hypothetical protein
VTEPTNSTPFGIVSDMEDDVAAVRDFGRAIAMLAETLGDNEGMAMQRIAWEIVRHAKSIEERRERLLQLLHPNRDHEAAAPVET